jgi:hypothetical protein
MRAPTSPRHTSSRSWASPASASPGSPGSSRSTSTEWPRSCSGTAVAASPTARASPTGRWPRWCACGPGSWRERSPNPRARSCARPSRATWRIRTSGSGSSRDLQCCSRSKRPAKETRPISSPAGGSSERLADRDRSFSSSRTCSGRRAAARSSSVLARLVAEPPALRARPRTTGARRAASQVGEARATRRPCSEPLAEDAMRAPPRNFVPGLPDDIGRQVLDRAEGIRSTRSRRSGCFSTADCSSERGHGTR